MILAAVVLILMVFSRGFRIAALAVGAFAVLVVIFPPQPPEPKEQVRLSSAQIDALLAE